MNVSPASTVTTVTQTHLTTSRPEPPPPTPSSTIVQVQPQAIPDKVTISSAARGAWNDTDKYGDTR